MGWGEAGKRKSWMNIRKCLQQESSYHLKHLKAGQTSSHYRAGNTPFQDADFHYHHLHFGLQWTQTWGKTPRKRRAAWVRASNLSLSLQVILGCLCQSPVRCRPSPERADGWILKQLLLPGTVQQCGGTNTAYKRRFLQKIYNPPLNPLKGLNNVVSTGFLWKNDSQEGWQQCTAIKY